MKRNHAAPTMKDVAREAGVSLGTVSKVINGIPVSEKLRLRVDNAIAMLGYHVNNYARSLKTNRTNCVALVMPSLRHPFFAILTDELTACLTRRGYSSILLITNFDPEAEKKSFILVRQNKADGVIALTYSPDLETDGSIPIVTIDRHLGRNVPCVFSDNYHGGELAAEKLLELGCKKLLFLRIGPDIPSEADNRRRGFEDRCQAENAAFESVILHDRETEEPFYAFLREHIHGGKLDFDGIFCNTDGLACQILDFLRDLGIDIPGDVQLIGYDGMTNFATGKYLCSTIVQPLPLMAEAAVDILLNTPSPEADTNIRLPVRYVSGGTTRD